MDSLEQGTIIVGSSFYDRSGYKEPQYEIVGVNGELIQTNVPVSNQIKGQLLLDYDTGIEKESLPVLQNKLDYIDERIKSTRRSHRYSQRVILGLFGFSATFTTAALVIPNSSGESFISESIPAKIFAIANGLAHVSIAASFYRQEQNRCQKELAPLLEEQARYQANIAALCSLITINKTE